MKKLIDQVILFSSKQQYPQDFDVKEFANFINAFYLQNQGRDFENYSIEELYYSAFISFNFIQNKKPNQSKVKLSNPHKETGNFDSQFTFIDIINDDMPFLVDSIVAYLDGCGIKIKNIIHPIFFITRDANGNLEKITNDKSLKAESVIQIHLEKLASEGEFSVLENDILKILQNAALIVADWKPMLALLERSGDQINNAKKYIADDNWASEIKDFISWLHEGNVIFLGAKEFDIVENKGTYSLVEVKNSSYGVFRSTNDDYRPEVLNSSIQEVADSVDNPYVIEILKSRYRSRIHRATTAERVRIQKFSANGEVIGEFRFIGLFTSSAYFQNPNSIPLIRNKITEVIKQSGFVKGSHNYKDLISVLESYPRDELFQISVEDLLKNAMGIVAICGRSQVRFFARRDKFDRFVSCLIFTPRDRASSDLREKIKNYLAQTYQGEVVDFFVQITESNLTRLHVIIKTNRNIPKVDELEIEKRIAEMARAWTDDLRDAVSAKFEGEQSIAFYKKYKDAFSVSYCNRFNPQRAALDIAKVEESLEQNLTIFNLYKSSELSGNEVVELKIYSPGKEISLSQIMPVLESFGFNVIQEHTYTVSINENDKDKTLKKVWIQYFHLNLSKIGHSFSEKIKLNFEKTISKIWKHEMQVGMLNRLVITSELNWKQIFLLRGYTKYLYQTGFRYSSSYISDVLVKYSEISKLLVELFEIKFDPAIANRDAKLKALAVKTSSSLAEIKDIVDDVVIRKFFGLVNATLRTNYYQSSADGKFKGYVSFKFDSSNVCGLPLPVPYAEIFVYSTKVEAIHLRGGKVARGGLRWSDRQEDFRTEVLGLMKAQMTKNAVIVPVGSKGGFVVKRDMTGLNRDEVLKEGIECYKTFLRGVLDITDNVILGKIQHPQNVVMYDGEDPYLVVAADKGTATFSDIANSISAEYNFWLGDAFASGGSVGYDHKKMGITAKGAWISVMRHFREMGVDTQSQDFTCAGIGDLAGDVFGNGMLLSKHIKLVAAFNHMHIFLDPNPDVAKSFVERERMFNLPRSSWTDYDASLISQGGGVFERSAKSIKISAEVKAILDIEEDELTPVDLMKAILRAPVDLLWNGGIGTYVKAIDESNQDVGDRANDALRINGLELRCKVVVEGGNLGFTQKGRIEYALNGGAINTDAMDNSAGVDCSDHEVNIKIALTTAMRDNKINLEERNKVLEAMTDNVSSLVLMDNHLQTQAISIALNQGVMALGDQSQFLSSLEKTGLLNRKIEFLPSKKEIEKRQIDKKGLTRPEICVMLAYAKMDIYNQLLTSNLLDDPYFNYELFSYFPTLMQEKFADEIRNHQLKKEIIATQITNYVVNKSGITFVNQLCENSGFALADVIRSLIIVVDSLRLNDAWQEIENLDGKVEAKVQLEMFVAANKLLERSVMWLLRNQVKGDIQSNVERFGKISNDLFKILPEVLSVSAKEAFVNKIEEYCSNNIPQNLSEKIASIEPIASTFDIAEITAESDFDLKTIATIYFAVSTRFSLRILREKIAELDCDSYWQKLSTKTVIEDLYLYQMRIAKKVVEYSCDNSCEIDAVENWIKTLGFLVERFDNVIEEIKSNPNLDLSIFIVALNRLKPLVVVS
jgi:glutamate dehydrogenase